MQAIVSPSWSRALGRGTYGGWVVGQDGEGLLRTLYAQVRRLLSRFQPLMAGSNTRALHTRCTASTARRRDTLECTCCSEGGSALRVRVCELPQFVDNAPPSQAKFTIKGE
jgi:hypothetical protein